MIRRSLDETLAVLLELVLCLRLAVLFPQLDLDAGEVPPEVVEPGGDVGAVEDHCGHGQGERHAGYRLPVADGIGDGQRDIRPDGAVAHLPDIRQSHRTRRRGGWSCPLFYLLLGQDGWKFCHVVEGDGAINPSARLTLPAKAHFLPELL